jgi:charged multivesicular body protein 4A/B
LKKVEQQVAEAKAKMAKGDKKGALFAMKRKKMYEAEVDKIQNVKMTLETQVINLESAAQNAATFDAMKSGTATMKKIRNEVGIEKVDDIMDEIKEEMEMAQEVNAAIAQPIDPLMADEDELLAELEGLEAADLEAELLAPPIKPVEDLSLPTVPAAKLPQPSLANDEADELKKLEAELAGL